MELRTKPLFEAQTIGRRVSELAAQISKDYAGQQVCLLAVLKGGLVFAADLMRALTVPIHLDFVGVRSYRGTESSGTVSFTYLPAYPLAGRHVLLVEDILDTGRTMEGIVERLQGERPASVRLCTLLDKPCRRIRPVTADYVGFTIDDLFVVGYGLDYEEMGRELPEIRVLHQDGKVTDGVQ